MIYLFLSGLFMGVGIALFFLELRKADPHPLDTMNLHGVRPSRNWRGGLS